MKKGKEKQGEELNIACAFNVACSTQYMAYGCRLGSSTIVSSAVLTDNP